MKQLLKQYGRHFLLIIGCTMLFGACKDNTVNTETSHNSSINTVPNTSETTSEDSAALITVTGNGAVTYDLQSDWSDTENPNGVWALNAGDKPLVAVDDLSSTGIDVWNFKQPGFTAQPIFGDITPVWFQAKGPLDNGNPDWEVGDIVTHTSRGFVPNSNVTWTSDIDGLVDVTGNVWATREFGRTNDWFIYLNDELLTSGTVSDGDPFDRDNPFPFKAGSGGATALESLSVSVGDVIKLEFQEAGIEDYVGVNFTVTVVAPATKDDCKNGGWEQFGFWNQGQCVRFVETGSKPGNPFVGSWKSTDPVDGSEIQVSIANDAPGSVRDLVWLERNPGLCDGEDIGGVLRAETRLVGDRLRLFNATIRCNDPRQGSIELPDIFAFVHSPGTNTLDFWVLDENGDLDFIFVPCFYRSEKQASCA